MEFENHSRVSVNLSPRPDSSEFVHSPGILHYMYSSPVPRKSKPERVALLLLASWANPNQNGLRNRNYRIIKINTNFTPVPDCEGEAPKWQHRATSTPPAPASPPLQRGHASATSTTSMILRSHRTDIATLRRGGWSNQRFKFQRDESFRIMNTKDCVC